MGVIAVIVAAAAGFAFGALWHGVLVRRAWRAEYGLPEPAIAAHLKAPAPCMVAFAAALCTAGLLRHVFSMSGLAGAGEGLTAGLGAGPGGGTVPRRPVARLRGAQPEAGADGCGPCDGGHAMGACGVIGLTPGLFA